VLMGAPGEASGSYPEPPMGVLEVEQLAKAKAAAAEKMRGYFVMSRS
jgi:hypothetical protein